jgi:hypothetical protein
MVVATAEREAMLGPNDLLASFFCAMLSST